MKKNMTIGEITKPHGVKGEVKVYPLTDDLERFQSLKEILIEEKPYRIEEVKLLPDRVILKIRGFDSVEAAETLRGKTIEVKREHAVKLEKDAYFVEDLKGCRVYDTEGKDLGPVYEVISTGSNDVYWIREPKELLIPALKTIVQVVDIEEGKIVIVPVREWSYED
ncbi:MAG TPA: ribosome maturation factor RimM [Clostridiaceae bacterium]|nr:ribosome maturation factor RimM [Clostridiaceae bacterium]